MKKPILGGTYSTFRALAWDVELLLVAVTLDNGLFLVVGLPGWQGAMTIVQNNISN